MKRRTRRRAVHARYGFPVGWYFRSAARPLLIRRADWKPKDDLPKYWQVKGSGNGCYVIGKPGLPVVLVESVLDAVLIWQEARDLVAAVALTGSTKKPDAQTTDFLRNAPGILWALDFDEAGRKASAWWREHFPGMRTWPCAAGKDPGEMLKVGIPIRPWLEAVLLCEPAPCRETHKNAPQSAERQKHDSGLMPQLEPSANDTLERLAALDTNIAALVGWEVVPHLQDGELVIDGLDRLDTENRAGLECWFAHKGPNGEPRRERVIRALRTGRRAAC